jgi:hypothetical protein
MEVGHNAAKGLSDGVSGLYSLYRHIDWACITRLLCRYGSYMYDVLRATRTKSRTAACRGRNENLLF